MARIFISYKRVDKDKVFKIKDQIESALGEKCWIDLDGIESDAQFVSVIINAINKAEIVLFMYSRSHTLLTDFENDYTIRELSYANIEKKRIVFINIDGSPLSSWFKFMYSQKQQVDARSDEAIKRLINDLYLWLGKTHVLNKVLSNHETDNVEIAYKSRHNSKREIDWDKLIEQEKKQMIADWGLEGYNGIMKRRQEEKEKKLGREGAKYGIGKYVFDSYSGTLLFGTQQTKLSSKESELLYILYMNANKTVEVNYIVKEIWDDVNYFNIRTMRSYIEKLRNKLSNDKCVEILEVKNIGYKLIAN